MCDDYTEQASDTAIAAPALTRRNFAAIGAAALVTGCATGSESANSDLSERTVTFRTADGIADAFFVHPAKGKHPGVIIWPDIGGLRDAFKAMARRLAGEGYAVLAINQFYRNAPAPVLTSFAEWRTPEGRAKLAPMIANVTPEATARDAAACVAFLDGDPAVSRRRKIGTQGYCMGGSHAVRTAAAVPARIGAVASFHGGGLATDAANSPHRLLPATRASYLIAVARNDDERGPAEKDTFWQAADAAGRKAEVEVYPADHGWCVADSPVYEREQAERAWTRLLALYAGL